MKQGLFTIEQNAPLTATVYKMVLSGDVSAITAPGQFINIQLQGKYLRRPISVYDVQDGRVTIIYKVVGGGTDQMSRMTEGQTLDVLTGLGNGYDTALTGESPLLLGGGVGVPPLYLLAKRLRAEGKRVRVVLGFNTADEVFCVEEFESLGCEVTVTTADGSRGVKGFVTGVMDDAPYTHVCTCGPEGMLKAVYRECKTDGQFSFEERMGCGFGACMGCSCQTITGYKRICKEGPVMRKGDILWED